jgi:flavin-binding protein dodecin
MSIHKIIEVSTSSSAGWEDAAQQAVDEAARTVKNIRHLYIEDLMAEIDNNKITNYRVHAKITFEITK